jgi:hypothetical protein
LLADLTKSRNAHRFARLLLATLVVCLATGCAWHQKQVRPKPEQSGHPVQPELSNAPFEVPVLLLAEGTADSRDSTEVLTLDGPGFRYGSSLLPFEGSTAEMFGAAYYPRHDLLVTVNRRCRVVLHARGQGVFQGVAQWASSAPDSCVATAVSFSVVPGLLWIEYRGANDRETEQITIPPKEIALGPHARGWHIAEVTSNDGLVPSSTAVYQVNGDAMRIHFPDGREQILKLPLQPAWPHPKDRVTIDRQAGTVVSVVGAWAFYDSSARYLGVCAHGAQDDYQMSRAARGGVFLFSPRVMGAAIPLYRCDFATRRLVIVPSTNACSASPCPGD